MKWRRCYMEWKETILSCCIRASGNGTRQEAAAKLAKKRDILFLEKDYSRWVRRGWGDEHFFFLMYLGILLRRTLFLGIAKRILLSYVKFWPLYHVNILAESQISFYWSRILQTMSDLSLSLCRHLFSLRIASQPRVARNLKEWIVNANISLSNGRRENLWSGPHSLASSNRIIS